MSHIARIFVEQPLASARAIPLPEGQSKYLLRVMRLTEGARVRAFNGEDGEWACVLSVDRKTAILTPQACTRPQETAPGLTLLFAPIKKARTDFIVEKATELGVSDLQPVMTDYTQTQRVRTDRMRLLAIEAAEQTERMDLPTIHEAAALPKILASWDTETPLIYCDEASDAAPLSQHANRLQRNSGGILIGPEGGFSPKEREMLRALEFVIPISLGPRILRAETAVVSALTLWQSEVGDWQKAPYLPEA
ncbi:MAG: 16S rRNA (uracil(1498)-N(3))-methyltransferase [Hyphomonadaceae bacterium]|nr:16S rRNA (uracil(1498)-N(3))-methyltransferase [Hyphomonadaceae bacterium]